MNVVANQFSTTAYLSPKHKSHIENRGLLNEWSYANCRTVSADEASVYLGYAAKSGGILFLGKTTQFQFRPDKPWKSSGSKRAPKYRTPVEEYDAFLPQHPTDKNYWDPENLKQHCYHIDDHPYLLHKIDIKRTRLTSWTLKTYFLLLRRESAPSPGQALIQD
jgi:putative DNA primase/helicase